MTTEEIANYCEIKNCSVTFGSSEGGFVRIDGTGVTGRFSNYRRFLAHNELASLPEAEKVLGSATVFRVESATGTRELSPGEFEAELTRLLQLAGV